MADVNGKCPYCGMTRSSFFMKMPYFDKIKIKCSPSGYMNTDKDESKYCGKTYHVKVNVVMVSVK